MPKKPVAPPQVRPVSKKDAADAKGVTKGAVSLACRPGGPLHAALLDGGRLNSAHPAYVAWLAGARKTARADQAPTTPAKSGAKSRRAPDGTPTNQRNTRRNRGAAPPAAAASKSAEKQEPEQSPARVPTDDELEGLLKTFGTHRNLSDSLKLRKQYVDLSEKELRLQEAKGRLVKREILTTVIAAFDEAFHQLLTDLPKTAARELYARARSGSPLEEAESKTKALVSSHLTAAKDRVRQILRDKHDPTP